MCALVIQARSAMIVGFLVVPVGCKSTGSGKGESSSGDVQAHFTWQQPEPAPGTRTATLSGQGGSEETYQGKFYQTRKSRWAGRKTLAL
jgi:hypothetical protein